MNCLLNEKYLAVEGLDNAMKMAKVLIEQEYQVFVQYEDCDIYIVAYASNDVDFGGDQFALLDEDEVEMILQEREDRKFRKAVEVCKDAYKWGSLDVKQITGEEDENQDDLIKDMKGDF